MRDARSAHVVYVTQRIEMHTEGGSCAFLPCLLVVTRS